MSKGYKPDIQDGLGAGFRRLKVFNKDAGKDQYPRQKVGGRWYPILSRTIQDGRQIRVMSSLPEDSWKSVEDMLISEASTPMSAVQDLRNANLVIQEEFWVKVHEYEVDSGIVEPQVSMGLAHTTAADMPQTTTKGISIPAVRQDFNMDARVKGAWNTKRTFARDVLWKIRDGFNWTFENALFNGFGDVKVSAATETYGYINHPDTLVATSTGAWSTPANIETTVAAMIEKMSASPNWARGPYQLLVPDTQYREMANKFMSTTGDESTPYERVMVFPQIAEIKSVATEFLPDGTVLLVQLTDPNLIAWIEGMPLTMVEFKSPDGITDNWAVMQIGAPRVGSTYNDRSGVCVCTGN